MPLAEDLEDIVRSDTTRSYRKDLMFAYDNLPEQLQYLDLLRDTGVALETSRLPSNRVSARHFATRHHYKREESQMQDIELFAPLSSRELSKWANRAQARDRSIEAATLHALAKAQRKAEAQAKLVKKAMGGGKQSSAGLLEASVAQDTSCGNPCSDGESRSVSDDEGDFSEEESEFEDDMADEGLVAQPKQDERAIEAMSSLFLPQS